MSITSGFFNSIDGDRRYNAEDMSRLFSGIITDGVFMNVGDVFSITAYSTDDLPNCVKIGSGRAWFDNIWVNNDDTYYLTFTDANTTMDRYDAVIIDINKNDYVRFGSIEVIAGTPSIDSPDKPTLISTETHKQYPLAYVYRKSGSTGITQADIQVCVGTSVCPYITSVLESTDIDNLVIQWRSQWNNKIRNLQSDYESWFGTMQAILDSDTATKITNDMLILQKQLNELATNHTISSTILDSSGNMILDSSGASINGLCVLMFDSDIPTTDEINAMFW